MSPSATPATQRAAAHTASAGNPVRHQSPPSAISATPATQSEDGMSPSATPATQSEGGCHQVPRLPHKKPRRPRHQLRLEACLTEPPGKEVPGWVTIPDPTASGKALEYTSTEDASGATNIGNLNQNHLQDHHSHLNRHLKRRGHRHPGLLDHQGLSPSRHRKRCQDGTPPSPSLSMRTLYNKILHVYSGTPVRSRLNIDMYTRTFALSHVQGPMANSVQNIWRQYLRRTAMYTCLCFQLANTEVIADSSWKFSDLEWLRIYNAAVKRGGMLHQNYYLSAGAIMAMVGRNDDSQATSSQYLVHKRNLPAGLGGRSSISRWSGKKTMSLQEDSGMGRPSCSPTSCTGAGGMTNIQYGLDDLGYFANPP